MTSLSGTHTFPSVSFPGGSSYYQVGNSLTVRTAFVVSRYNGTTFANTAPNYIWLLSDGTGMGTYRLGGGGTTALEYDIVPPPGRYAFSQIVVVYRHYVCLHEEQHYLIIKYSLHFCNMSPVAVGGTCSTERR